jgi:hypothetical protein
LPNREPFGVFKKKKKKKRKRRQKKKSVSKKVPEHMPARRTTGRHSEASAIDIETSGDIEDQGAEKDQQEKIADENRSGQPNAQDQRETDQQLNPGQKEGDEVDQHVGKNLIVVNDLRKRHRVDNLVEAGVDKDSSQE